MPGMDQDGERKSDPRGWAHWKKALRRVVGVIVSQALGGNQQNSIEFREEWGKKVTVQQRIKGEKIIKANYS